MRRTVWIVVFTMLVLAVVAQSITVVERRHYDEVTEQVLPDGRTVTIRTVPSHFSVPFLEGGRASAQPRGSSSKKTKPAPPDEKEVIWRATVESKMLPTNAAFDDAMERAQSRIMHDLNLHYLPSRDYVRNRMLDHWDPKPGPTVEGVAETVSVVFNLQLTREVWRELAQFERAGRVRERMGGLAVIIAIATVLLACVAGYIRLDEYTKGYYTWRLRLLAVGIVGIVAFVLANEL